MMGPCSREFWNSRQVAPRSAILQKFRTPAQLVSDVPNVDAPPPALAHIRIMGVGFHAYSHRQIGFGRSKRTVFPMVRFELRGAPIIGAR